MRYDLEKFFNLSIDLLSIAGTDGYLKKVNPAFERTLGWSQKELLSRPFIDFVHPDDVTATLNELCKLATGIPTISFENRYRCLDGTYRHLLWTSFPEKESGLLYSVARDNTIRKQAEEELEGSRQRLAGILEIADDAIISIDDRQRIILFNHGAERIFGYQAGEVMGRSLSLLLPRRLREVHEKHIGEFAASASRARGKDRNVQIFGLRKNGTEFPAEASISKLEIDGERIFTVILRDITERKEAENALREQAHELARSNIELEQFAYVASHDLQEPLRMISSYTQLLAKRYRGKLDDDADEFIHFAVDGAERMQRLINDLLAYSRVGTRGQEFKAVSCGEVLEQVLSNLKVRIQETGAVVTRDELPTVTADPVQLQQVFQNLISNAIKFRRKSPPRVHLSAVQKGREWIFSVQDHGIGIDSQYKERIFVIFQRLHTVGKYPGTGIGLAICKKIVERHGGRIWLESQPGQGTTFYFSIPIRKGGRKP